MTKKVHVCIVLDRSGSMETCRTDAIGAVNSYLRQLKDDKEMHARVSLIIFDSGSIDTIRDRVPAATCPELAPAEYEPRASTPLLDAVGRGVGVLDNGSDKDDRRILAVMTDGLENASREFTKESLKALLDRKQKEEGWLVLYLGADHDSWSQAQQLGFAHGNVANFSKGNFNQTVGATYARSARYVASDEPARAYMSDGFTPEERESMIEDDDARRPSK